MEIRFFAPGTLVSNPGLCGRHFWQRWRSLSAGKGCGVGCRTLERAHRLCHSRRPHLPLLKKKALGLPHLDQATERQRRDGMCWKDENEFYNAGSAFRSPAAIIAESWSPSSRITITDTAKGGEDPDQLRGEPLRHERGKNMPAGHWLTPPIS